MKNIKIVTAIVLAIVLSMALAACGANDAGYDAGEDAGYDSVSAEGLGIEGEAPLETLAKARDSSTGWESMYAPTLQMYWDLSKGADIDRKLMNTEDTLGNTFLPDGFPYDFAKSDFYYAYYDIDGDSIPELLVNREQPEEWIATAAFYSISGNNVIPVLFTHYFIYGQVHLAKSGQGSAYIVESGGDEGFGGASIYEIARGPRAVLVDSLSVAYSYNAGKQIYLQGRNGETIIDGDSYIGKEISENEFNALAAKYGGDMYGYFDRSNNYIEVDWMRLQNPVGASLTVAPDVKGGIFIRSEPVITGNSSVMADGNKIGYIRAGKTDIILKTTGSAETDKDGFTWYEVRIPQDFRDTEEQTKYFSGKPLIGWVREDVVVFVKTGGSGGPGGSGVSGCSFNEKIFDLLGKTPAELEKNFGKYIESSWLNGPIHKFGNHWFSFEGTDRAGYPTGKSEWVFCSLSDVINGLDSDIKASDLEKIIGKKGEYFPNKNGGNEMYDEGYLLFYYGDYGFDTGCSPDMTVKKNNSACIWVK